MSTELARSAAAFFTTFTIQTEVVAFDPLESSQPEPQRLTLQIPQYLQELREAQTTQEAPFPIYLAPVRENRSSELSVENPAATYEMFLRDTADRIQREHGSTSHAYITEPFTLGDTQVVAGYIVETDQNGFTQVYHYDVAENAFKSVILTNTEKSGIALIQSGEYSLVSGVVTSESGNNPQIVSVSVDRPEPSLMPIPDGSSITLLPETPLAPLAARTLAVNADELNVRAKPSAEADSEILFVLDGGAELTMIEFDEVNGWYKVRYTGADGVEVEGWVSAQYTTQTALGEALSLYPSPKIVIANAEAPANASNDAALAEPASVGAFVSTNPEFAGVAIQPQGEGVSIYVGPGTNFERVDEKLNPNASEVYTVKYLDADNRIWLGFQDESGRFLWVKANNLKTNENVLSGIPDALPSNEPTLPTNFNFDAAQITFEGTPEDLTMVVDGVPIKVRPLTVFSPNLENGQRVEQVITHGIEPDPSVPFTNIVTVNVVNTQVETVEVDLEVVPAEVRQQFNIEADGTNSQGNSFRRVEVLVVNAVYQPENGADPVKIKLVAPYLEDRTLGVTPDWDHWREVSPQAIQGMLTSGDTIQFFSQPDNFGWTEVRPLSDTEKQGDLTAFIYGIALDPEARRFYNDATASTFDYQDSYFAPIYSLVSD